MLLRQSQWARCRFLELTRLFSPPADACVLLSTCLVHALNLDPVSHILILLSLPTQYHSSREIVTDLGSCVSLVLEHQAWQGSFHKYLPPGQHILSLSKLDTTTPETPSLIPVPLRGIELVLIPAYMYHGMRLQPYSQKLAYYITQKSKILLNSYAPSYTTLIHISLVNNLHLFPLPPMPFHPLDENSTNPSKLSIGFIIPRDSP